MNQEYYKEEMMVKEAITTQKSDQEIGMPDIEKELQLVKQKAHKATPTLFIWSKVAATFLIILSISGLSWAYIHFGQTGIEPLAPEETVVDVVEEEQTQEEKPEERQITLSYEKASLEQIVEDLSVYYHLDKPVFENREAAQNYKMHITIKPDATLEEAIALLNHFGKVHIELKDNHIVVK